MPVCATLCLPGRCVRLPLEMRNTTVHGTGLVHIRVQLESNVWLVGCRYGWSANMQRIMAAQALGDGQMQAVLAGHKTLEINPRHPLIVQLLQQVEANEDDPAAAETATLLFETALLESGYPVSNQQNFADKVHCLYFLPLYLWLTWMVLSGHAGT